MWDGDSKTEGSGTHGERMRRAAFSPGTSRSIPFAIAAILLIASLAGIVAGHLDKAECTLARIQREGVIRVGYASEAPYAFRERDRVTGESPELARVALAAIGAPRIEWVQVEFRSLIPALLSGQFDMIAAGLFDTPERREKIAFSQPTFLAHTALLIRRDDEQRLLGLGSFLKPGSGRLAVLAGAYEGAAARRFGISPDHLIEVPDLVTGVEAIRSNQTAALALSRLSLSTFVSHAEDESLTVVYPLSDSLDFEAAPPSGGFGFRLEDTELRLAVDRALTDLIGTPEHLSLVDRFGFEASDLPSRSRSTASNGPATEPRR